MKKTIKALFDLLPAMLMWLMLSVFIWGWIFTFLTDAAPENKIVLYIDAPVSATKELALALEETGAEAIKLVKVHPFTHAMMDSAPLEQSDLYIVSASAVGTYADWFVPLPEALLDAGEVFTLEGTPMGLRIYDHASGTGAASQHVAYTAEGKAEDYYLFFGRQSLHVDTNEGAADNLAIDYARTLLTLP
ncbi:MAG: hypothetical protein IJ438_10990 [Clostridia bacterium]|nr:hypothetical protein [Clostridia bacterium]